MGAKPEIQIPQPKHIPDDIADQLRLAIFSRKYLPGDRLPPERDLSNQLKVHRASIREALKSLEAQGLLRIRHGDGVYVRDFLTEANVSVLEAYLFSKEGQNVDTFRAIQEFRILIQGEMARLAAERRTDEDLDAFELILSEEDRTSDPAAFRAADWAFAQSLARAGRNILFTFILNSVRPIHERWGALYFSIPGTIDATRRFHHLIVRAIAKKDAARAESVMIKLLDYSNPLLIQGLQKFIGGNP
jgi:GntR family transcriptional repressor for pyruvate dehydrogenase complex